MMEMNSGQATYSDDEGKSVEVSIMDGAGETGASMVVMYALTLVMETEQQTESGYTRLQNLMTIGLPLQKTRMKIGLILKLLL